MPKTWQWKMLRKNRVKFGTNTNLNSFQVYHDTCHVILFVTNKSYKNKQLADTILLVHIHTSKEKRNQGRLDNVTLWKPKQYTRLSLRKSGPEQAVDSFNFFYKFFFNWAYCFFRIKQTFRYHNVWIMVKLLFLPWLTFFFDWNGVAWKQFVKEW